MPKTVDQKILDYLRGNPQAKFRDIASECGLNGPGAAWFEVNRLVGSGKLRKEEKVSKWIVEKPSL